jgi:hypothetical protein
MAEMLLEPRTALGPRNLVRVLNQIRDLGGSDNAPGWIPAPLSVSSAKNRQAQGRGNDERSIQQGYRATMRAHRLTTPSGAALAASRGAFVKRQEGWSVSVQALRAPTDSWELAVRSSAVSRTTGLAATGFTCSGAG